MTSPTWLAIPTGLLISLLWISGCSPAAERPATPQVGGDDAAVAPEAAEGLALLEDASVRAAAMRQRICPVSQEPLGSMGKPILLTVADREVFICCIGCQDSLEADPEKYFARLDDVSADP